MEINECILLYIKINASMKEGYILLGVILKRGWSKKDDTTSFKNKINTSQPLNVLFYYWKFLICSFNNCRLFA